MLDLDLAAFEVPLHAPWEAVGAAELDEQTLATYFAGHLASASARSILEVAVKAIFGAGSGELSLLFALFYLHAGGGLTNLARTTGGAQERRFVGGSQQLAGGMAEELGERVVLGAPVESVDHGPDHVTIAARLVPPHADPAHPDVAHELLRVRARRAIFAMAPALCGRLRYSPPLPGNRDQLCQRMPMGAVTKVHVLYEEPFWRADGLNGQIVAPGSVLESTFDNSPHDASYGAVVGFVAGDDCRRMEAAGPEARQQAVLAELERAFGPRARTPIEIVEQHWPAEPFTRGGPVAVSVPGALTALGPALRAPVGSLHWAGTETATQWCGYLDGALSAGIRAADEVLQALQGVPLGLV
jgi:monoamine oxidase